MQTDHNPSHTYSALGENMDLSHDPCSFSENSEAAATGRYCLLCVCPSALPLTQNYIDHAMNSNVELYSQSNKNKGQPAQPTNAG